MKPVPRTQGVSPPYLRNLEPTAIHNRGSVPVEMEACEEVRFK